VLNKDLLFEGPSVDSNVVEVGLSIGYVINTNRELPYDTLKQKFWELNSSNEKDQVQDDQLTLLKNELTVVQDENTKTNKNFAREYKKCYGHVFEDFNYTAAKDMFSNIHIVGKRPSVMTNIVDIKFIYAPYKNILKNRLDFPTKLS